MASMLQTVDVQFPNSSLVFNTLELVPVNPNPYTCAIKTDHSVIAWHDDGTVTEKTADGTLKVWFAKPTLADAIHSNPMEKGSYFKFNSDGSVEAYWYSTCYYWSAPKDAPPVQGTPVYQCSECTAESPTRFDKDMCDACMDAIYRDYYRYGY